MIKVLTASVVFWTLMFGAWEFGVWLDNHEHLYNCHQIAEGRECSVGWGSK